MILIKSQGPVRPIKIKYMTEEGIKVSARPILVLTCCFYKGPEIISFSEKYQLVLF